MIRRSNWKFDLRKSYLSFSSCLSCLKFAFLFFILLASTAAAQVPTVEKIDPPSWWVGSTINPVRVLIKGTNLTGAKIESATPGITASNFSASANGHYLFADVKLSETVRPGKYQLTLLTTSASTNIPFEAFTPQPRLGNYNGFTPDDVIYFAGHCLQALRGPKKINSTF